MKQEGNNPVFFNNRNLIRCGGKLLDFTVPQVMGILNVTPDSFYDGGKFTQEKAILKHAGKLLKEGALILDIGAQSTRPGSRPIPETQELARLIPAVDAVRGKFPDAVISVDTSRARVALKCLARGASMVNDISGGADPDMFTMIAEEGVPYVLMHIQGTPRTMQKQPVYKNVTAEVYALLARKVSELRKMGVTDLLVDPGFGFGKTVPQNFALLKNLSAFLQLGCPLLAGISRKSLVCRVLDVDPKDALNGTTALHMAALIAGASLLRVHDVREAAETIRLYSALRDA